MTDETPRHVAATPVQFPPIPLLSGNTFTDAEGNEHLVDAVTVTITAADGTHRDLNLVYQFGGWWVADTDNTPGLA